MTPEARQELEEIERLLNNWLVSFTEGNFEDDEPEVDEARNLILERLEQPG